MEEEGTSNLGTTSSSSIMLTQSPSSPTTWRQRSLSISQSNTDLHYPPSPTTERRQHHNNNQQQQQQPRGNIVHPRPRPFYDTRFLLAEEGNSDGAHQDESFLRRWHRRISSNAPSRRRIRSVIKKSVVISSPSHLVTLCFCIFCFCILFSIFSHPVWWARRVFEHGPGSGWRIDWVSRGYSSSGGWGTRISSARNPPMPKSWAEYNNNANNIEEEEDKHLGLNVRPKLRPPADDPNVKYLAYNPHSGYHNQRNSLENAIVLANLMNRTLLVPPVWLGYQIPFIAFDKLRYRMDQASKDGLTDRCESVLKARRMKSSSRQEIPLPRECVGYPDYTLVSWDFLVDLDAISKVVPIVDRWDTTNDFFFRDISQGGLGLRGREIAFLKDQTLYDYKLYDEKKLPNEGLEKYSKRVNIEDLSKKVSKYRLIHFGTIFGSTRIRNSAPYTQEMRTLARKSMVLRNPVLDAASETVMGMIGGNHYVGLHLRLGDGLFREHANRNVWRDLYMISRKIGINDEVVGRVLGRLKYKYRTSTRKSVKTVGVLSLDEIYKEDFGEDGIDTIEIEEGDIKEIEKELKVKGELKDASKGKSSKPMMECKRAMHKDKEMQKFNIPLYLATDSKVPREDPMLSPIFQVFPCTFVLGDFTLSSTTHGVVGGLSELNRVYNAEDGTPLGPFMMPYLDAMIAAKAWAMVGTPHSTFSTFTKDVLHQVYHDRDIIERN